LRKSKHRSRLEIVADMLYATGEGSKKTHIMYGANLSFELTSRYLTDLVEAGLIQSRDDEYVVTEKGREFLKRFKEYSERRQELEEQMNDVNNRKEKLLKKYLNQGS